MVLKDEFTLHSAVMKNGQCAQELQSSTQASHESQGEQQTNYSNNGPIQDSGSVSASGNGSRKVSRQDIELVQNLIERCLQLYMNRDEIVKTLLTRARIDHGFTTLIWQKMEEENTEFFRAYYIRLKLKKQIILFNHLLEHQYHLMKYPSGPPRLPLAPIQNGMHSMAPVNMPMGYPVLQHPQMHVPGHPHLDAMGISSCHVVNGVPAPANFRPLRINTANDMLIDTAANDATPQVIPANSGGMPEMAASPASVASSGHFPFAPSDMSGMVMDTSVLDSAFTSDVGPDEEGAGNSRDSLGSFDQIPWNFSLTDLTADLSNLGDLGALGNYPGSPFLPSDSEIFLDSPEQEDIEFFVDSLPGPLANPDEEKP